MKIVEFGDKELELRASPLALLYYTQEFESDLIADLSTFQDKNIEELKDGDFKNFDSLLMLKMAWAMNKAEKEGKNFPPFEKWLNQLNEGNTTDPKFIIGVMTTAVDGFLSQRGK